MWHNPGERGIYSLGPGKSGPGKASQARDGSVGAGLCQPDQSHPLPGPAQSWSSLSLPSPLNTPLPSFGSHPPLRHSPTYNVPPAPFLMGPGKTGKRKIPENVQAPFFGSWALFFLQDLQQTPLKGPAEASRSASSPLDAAPPFLAQLPQWGK